MVHPYHIHVVSQDHADEAAAVDDTSRPLEDVLQILIAGVVAAGVEMLIGRFAVGGGGGGGGVLLPYATRAPPQFASKESGEEEEQGGDDGAAVVLVERHEQEVRQQHQKEPREVDQGAAPPWRPRRGDEVYGDRHEEGRHGDLGLGGGCAVVSGRGRWCRRWTQVRDERGDCEQEGFLGVSGATTFLLLLKLMILWGAIDDLFTLFSDQKDKQIKKKGEIDELTDLIYLM